MKRGGGFRAIMDGFKISKSDSLGFRTRSSKTREILGVQAETGRDRPSSLTAAAANAAAVGRGGTKAKRRREMEGFVKPFWRGSERKTRGLARMSFVRNNQTLRFWIHREGEGGRCCPPLVTYLQYLGNFTWVPILGAVPHLPAGLPSER